MDRQFLIFGFKKPDPKLVRFKRRFFKLVEGYYTHLKVSRDFGVTKQSTILRNFLVGTRRHLYAQGYTFEKANKILRKLEKLAKQVHKQLAQFELLDKLSEYEFHNATPLSLFALVRRCENHVTSSVTLTKRKE